MKRLALALMTSLAPGFALANPAILPTRDVSVDYTLSAPGQPTQTLTLAYNAAQEQARVTSEYGYYVLVNIPTGHAQLVIPTLHAIIQAPDFSALSTEFFKAESNAQFASLGKEHYAGLPCEVYKITDQKATARACLTADGVILHFSGHDAHGNAELTAKSVSYTAQPEGRFEPPEGLIPLNLPPGAIASLLAQQATK